MPNDDTSYYADLNPDSEEEDRVRGLLREAGLIEPNPTPPKPSDFPFEFPATFEVADSERDYYLRLVGPDREYTIDEYPILDPGDKVSFFESAGKARLSVSKKPNGEEEYDPKYGKLEIEPGVYEVTGTKGPGDEVSSPLEIAETVGAPLPDSDDPDGQTRSPNHADLNYQDYLWDILSEGHESDDRTGTGTIKSFGHQMRFDLTEGFPLLTSKTIDFENVARELLWFLRGQTNIWHLLKNDVGIWTGNAYARYKESAEDPHDKKTFEAFVRPISDSSSLEDSRFAEKWGDLGEIYGARWRDAAGFDQIENLIRQLQESPDSRRLRVDAWKPSVHMKGAPDEDEAALPPCHCSFQVFTRERPDGNRGLSLKWTQRSVDSFLGLPYNIASYALLTHLLAHQTGMIPETLIFSGGDCHIYRDHVAQVEELLSRTPRPELPQLKIGREEAPDDMGDYQFEDFSIEGYDPHPKIQAPLAV